MQQLANMHEQTQIRTTAKRSPCSSPRCGAEKREGLHVGRTYFAGAVGGQVAMPKAIEASDSEDEASVAVLCAICRGGDDTEQTGVGVFCSRCDKCFHQWCLVPPLQRIPKGDWYCSETCENEARADEEKYINEETPEEEDSSDPDWHEGGDTKVRAASSRQSGRGPRTKSTARGSSQNEAAAECSAEQAVPRAKSSTELASSSSDLGTEPLQDEENEKDVDDQDEAGNPMGIQPPGIQGYSSFVYRGKRKIELPRSSDSGGGSNGDGDGGGIGGAGSGDNCDGGDADSRGHSAAEQNDQTASWLPALYQTAPWLPLLQRAGSHMPEIISLHPTVMQSLHEKQYNLFREHEGKGRYRKLVPDDCVEELAQTHHLVIFGANGELSKLILAPTLARSFAYLRDSSAASLDMVNLKESRSEFAAGTSEHAAAKNEQRRFCATEAKARRAATAGLAIYLEGRDATSISMLLRGEGAFDPKEVILHRINLPQLKSYQLELQG